MELVAIVANSVLLVICGGRCSAKREFFILAAGSDKGKEKMKTVLMALCLVCLVGCSKEKPLYLGHGETVKVR